MDTNDLHRKIVEQRNLIKQYEAAVDDSDERRRADQAEITRLKHIIARLPVELTPKNDPWNPDDPEGRPF